MAEKGKDTAEAREFDRLREEHQKVVDDCEGRIKHWKKVAGDYEALNERLETLPDQLSYDITVPFGPLAFVPGKMVHTNEVTVLLGDNWFAKCSAKQAQKIVDHRMKYVNKEMEELLLTKKNFEARVEFTEDLEKMTGKKGDFVDIKEDVESNKILSTKGKRRVAHKRHSKPKAEVALHLEEEEEEEEEKGSGDRGGGGARTELLSEEELWARLDELERQEEEEQRLHRLPDNPAPNNKDTSSSSEEEEEEEEGGHGIKRPAHATVTHTRWVDSAERPAAERIEEEEEDHGEEEEEEEEEEGDSLPTIHFSHTVEPKKVRINTGKNTTLKFSERKEQKEQARRKKKNGDRNGHSHQESHKINSPTDIYRVFVDVKNGELLPRKSILKSRSRENSVCSDTSESSAADFEERRVYGRALSHEDATPSDTEEASPTTATQRPAGRFEAFSGTVVEKEHIPTALPHLTVTPPALPTILERRQEEAAPPEVPREEAAVPKDPPKRVSKFKAGRQQQHQ